MVQTPIRGVSKAEHSIFILAITTVAATTIIPIVITPVTTVVVFLSRYPLFWVHWGTILYGSSFFKVLYQRCLVA